MKRSPSIEAIKQHLAALPAPSDETQRQLLRSLLAEELAWREALIAKHGLTVFAHLADLPHLQQARPLFRARIADENAIRDAIRAARWAKVAGFHVNAKFIGWSKAHGTPSPAMLKHEREIVALRQQLVDQVLALALRQAAAFKTASKTHAAELEELVSIAVGATLDAIDKYTPDDGEVSARTWRSTVLGRISGDFGAFVERQHTAHLWPSDFRRLAALRGGRVEPSDVTDDDVQLLNADNVVQIATTASAYDEDGNIHSHDLHDPGPSPEEALIAAEEGGREAREAREDAAIAEARAANKRRKRGPVRSVRHVGTGRVFSTGREAADAFAVSPTSLCNALKSGRPIKGHRFEYADKKRRVA